MNIVNLTPHSVNVMNEKEEVIAIVPASGRIARVSSNREVVGDVDGIPIVHTVFGEVENLPEPKEDTLYLVSTLVLINANREDLISPDTATAVRKEGMIVGVKQFQK